MVKRIIAIAFVYLVATAGWVFLGGTLTYRTDTQDGSLKREVGQLWGVPLQQRAPWASLTVEGTVKPATSPATNVSAAQTSPLEKYDVPIRQNDIHVNLTSEPRQKGLLWYATYKVQFAANYVFENVQDKKGEMAISFAFPNANAIYDEFKFEVDGKSAPFSRVGADLIVARIPCEARARHTLVVNYGSQGLDRFGYRFGDGITEARNFSFIVGTNFDGYNFSDTTLSPTNKETGGGGSVLSWNYSDLITGNNIGIEMPRRINPGPMAARISFFAPVSLGFFFFLIFVIAMMKGIELHPMNYFFLAASFFAFHLLLAYLVDHISIHSAFAVCSMVSIILVVSYMRLVVGNRFAFFETALSQVVYLIGFSYAFFFEGFTGLSVAIGVVITLFIVMQLTAKINWSEKFQLANTTAKQLSISENQKALEPK